MLWFKQLFFKKESRWPQVVVGEIKALAVHPQADRLQLVKVDIGGQILDIVCGAFNIKIGDKVPTALVGASLPNGLTIKEAVIRGQASAGMLCAVDELGLGTDHTGILILKKQARLGQAIDKYLK